MEMTFRKKAQGNEVSCLYDRAFWYCRYSIPMRAAKATLVTTHDDTQFEQAVTPTVMQSLSKKEKMLSEEKKS